MCKVSKVRGQIHIVKYSDDGWVTITTFSDGCDNGNIFHDGRRTISPIVVVIPIIIIIPLDVR